MQVERDKHAGLNQHIHLHIHPFVFSVLFTFGKRPGSIIIVQPDMAFVCVCVCVETGRWWKKELRSVLWKELWGGQQRETQSNTQAAVSTM